MARWDELIFKGAELVNDAQDYLQKRGQAIHDPRERAGIQQWSGILQERARAINAIEQQYRTGQIVPYVEQTQEPTYVILSEELDLNGRHLASLHEWYDYQNVDLVFSTFERHLQNLMQAGPHGSGGGPPGGGPAGQGGGPRGAGGGQPRF
jgi:hypothetical protein